MSPCSAGRRQERVRPRRASASAFGARRLNAVLRGRLRHRAGMSEGERLHGQRNHEQHKAEGEQPRNERVAALSGEAFADHDGGSQ
ncbi:MAG: hypothetical protein ACYDHN_09535 [Solirubrobacteraceae bacterium]